MLLRKFFESDAAPLQISCSVFPAFGNNPSSKKSLMPGTPFLHANHSSDSKVIVYNSPSNSINSSTTLDLTVGRVFGSSILLSKLNNPEELSKKDFIYEIKPDHDGKILLEADSSGKKIYYIESLEEIHSPENINLLCDAKSSLGRLGIMSDDKNFEYRRHSPRAKVISSVQPFAFPIIITPGKSSIVAAAARMRNSDFLSSEEVIKSDEIRLLESGNEVNKASRLSPDGLTMHFNTHIAYRAKRYPEPIDIDSPLKYNPEDYFDVIEGNGRLILDPKRFYLLGTNEEISLGNVFGYITRQTATTGSDLWVHFAGQIREGFRGEITMECLSQNKRLIEKGDYAGFVKFDSIDSLGTPYNGVYQNQRAPTLPRFFTNF